MGALLGAATVLVPGAVWEEAVEEGKRRMYEDAYILERVLAEGGAEVVGHEESEEAKQLLGQSATFFGAGERAALAVYFGRGADGIFSDDGAFLRLLAGAAEPIGPIRALVPTAAIVGLAESGKLTVKEAREALDRIEPFVRDAAYEAAVDELGRMDCTVDQRDAVDEGA